MSETIQDLYSSFSSQMEPIQSDDRYFRYLYEMAQAGETELEQKREVLAKVVDEAWIGMVEDSLDSINAIIEKPRRFITTEEEVVPVSLARKISADSVRHLSQNTQFLAASDDGEVHPTRILNVQSVETYDLYENRFVYHLIQRLLAFVDKRTDVIFWSTGNEVRNRLRMHSKIDDAYEEIEYTVEMTVKNRQSFAENDADNVDVFMRIDRVRRLVMALRSASFCQIMAGCAKVKSPIHRTNLIMKDPDYRKCYELWQFMERYDGVGYTIDVQDSELAFDDEYLVSMYTNLVNNYAVFKSLTEDERALTELESTRREPVRPKFVKQIKEEIVESPDIPDVEVRRVFVEEVTQAQLDAEAALAEARDRISELEAQLGAWKAEVNALNDEKDDLEDELDEARTQVAAAKNDASIAQAAEADARAEAERAREDARAAEARAAKAQEDAAAEIVSTQAELIAAKEDAAMARERGEKKLAELREETDAALASCKAEAEAAVEAAREEADAAVAAAKAEAEEAARAAREEADAAAAAAKAEAEAEVAQARQDADTLVAAANAAGEAAVAEAREAGERKVAAAEAELRQARASQEAAEARAAAAEQAVEEARSEAEAAVEAARADADRRVNAHDEELDARYRELTDRLGAEAEAARAEGKARLEDAAAERESALAAAREKADAAIAQLRAELERTERARSRAQRKADANSLSKYLLAKLRGEGEADGAGAEGGDDGAGAAGAEGGDDGAGAAGGDGAAGGEDAGGRGGAC